MSTEIHISHSQGTRFDSKTLDHTPRRRFVRHLVVMLLAGGSLGFAGCASTPTTTGQLTGPIDKVVVKKSERKLELMRRGKVVRQYRVALGNSPVGHKVREGDGRTPVGTYVLNARKPQSQFYKAIHISYPNEQDRLNARRLGFSPGGNILLHGMPKYIQSESMHRQYASRDWTKGCIALQNSEMDEIYRVVQVGTPIEIRP